MRSVGSIALVLLATVSFVSCNRDPNVVKQRYLESGNRYFDKGRFKESRIQYMRALKIDPRYGAAHYRLALADLKLEKPDWLGAVKELRRAVELLKPDKPDQAANHWDAVVKLSEIYLSPLVTHDPQLLTEVEVYCKQLLERDSNSFDGHRLAGDLNYIRAVEAAKIKNTEESQKELDKALAEYRTADGIKSGDRGVTMQLARGLTLKSDLAGAEQCYRKVIASDKSYAEAYRELYTLLFYQNKRSDAEQLLKLGYQNNPKEFRYLIWLAEQYVIEQRRGDMLGILQQLKSKAGEYDRAYLDVGDFYLRMGDGDSAIKEYKEGMAKDAKNRLTYLKREVEVLMRQGKRAEAAEVNAQILKESPGDADARGVAATLMLDKGDVSKAMTELQEVVTRAPGNPVAHYNLGRAYVMHGDRPQARQQFQKAIELRPDYILARLALAQLQVAEGDYEAALRTARDIQRYDPNNVNARLIESAALMGQKKFGDSRQLLETMLKANPSSPDVMFQIGVVNLAENKYKDAEDSFRRAYQLNPANTRGL
ncbi:MAG: tetratricopeptide repeat protein, partial [Acidobacteriia bacterium]|nr:tetratricopeptide repeat protein [Terriglobia bacterium]